MQRRFKQEEEEHDGQSNFDEEMSFNGMGVMKMVQKDEQVQEYEHEVSGTHISSDETASSSEEKREKDGEHTNVPVKNNSSTGSLSRGKSGKRNVYIPAYRKRLQETASSFQKAGELEGNNNHTKSTSTSIASVDTPKRQNSQPNMFDQMIPMLPDSTASANGSGSIFEQESAPKRNASNDTLLKTFGALDLGAYPRRASSVHLNGSNINNSNTASSAISSRHSLTSLHTHVSSPSISSKPTVENVFDTPKSSKVLALPAENDSAEQYRLQNNYDIRNNTQIAEEDQYENEFTNYSENKREFIDSLRPKRHA
ncbi:unnamed protein product [Kluyveromyces dobzhanskii CBS 2104]|nr:unnamed protein product [Kluyveromyces dobzhanskii CBS 2104]